ncbi:cytochrome c oxidase assembly factor 4 homolog, mitochondrial [Stigmatopora argus]
MTSPSPHDRSTKRLDIKDDEDPVEQMISRTGCADLHEELQNCMAQHQDWRACQNHVDAFKKCMSNHHKARQEHLSKARQMAKITPS